MPYLAPELNGEKLLVGANFASAGIGILNDTGVQFVSPFSIRILDVSRNFQYLFNIVYFLDFIECPFPSIQEGRP